MSSVRKIRGRDLSVAYSWCRQSRRYNGDERKLAKMLRCAYYQFVMIDAKTQTFNTVHINPNAANIITTFSLYNFDVRHVTSSANNNRTVNSLKNKKYRKHSLVTLTIIGSFTLSNSTLNFNETASSAP